MIKTIRKNMIIYFLIFLTVVAFLFSTSNTRITYASSNYFDQTNVLEDLKSSEGFNILRYPYSDIEDKVEIINFVEYCYSYKSNMQENYGLYVYLYNPTGKNIDTNSTSNAIQMAIAYNEDGTPLGYGKFNLQFCSKSEDSNYKNLFYKFKIIEKKVNGTTFFDRVNSNQRRYDVSGIEITTYGKNLPDEYGVGGTYLFTGYAKGYGPDETAESNLTCDVNKLETIELEVFDTYYRTGEYEHNHRHDLTSVYFAVPNRFFEEYGKLQKIKAEWYEYETTPICITSNDTVYDLLYPYLGKYTNESDENYLQLYTGWQEMVGSSGHYDKYDWAYNCDYTKAINESCKRISYLFSTNGERIANYVLSSERIQAYVESYNKTFSDGYIDVPGKRISHDLFEKTLYKDRETVHYVDENIHHKLVEFDADNTFDMLNYDAMHSGWQRFFAGLFGMLPNDMDQSYKGISPIHIVTSEDMARDNLSSILLIDGDEDALEEFRGFYEKSVEEDKTVVLFRFAQTDYENLPVIAYNSATGKNLSGDYGKDTYIIQETIFFNFDIIELTFNKEGVYTVIPVVNSPIDIYNDITVPDNTGLEWWQILIAIICLFLVLWLLSVTGLLPLIVKLILWLILLPFRLIMLIIKAIKRKTN